MAMRACCARWAADLAVGHPGDANAVVGQRAVPEGRELAELAGHRVARRDDPRAPCTCTGFSQVGTAALLQHSED